LNSTACAETKHKHRLNSSTAVAGHARPAPTSLGCTGRAAAVRPCPSCQRAYPQQALGRRSERSGLQDSLAQLTAVRQCRAAPADRRSAAAPAALRPEAPPVAAGVPARGPRSQKSCHGSEQVQIKGLHRGHSAEPTCAHLPETILTKKPQSQGITHGSCWREY